MRDEKGEMCGRLRVLPMSLAAHAHSREEWGEGQLGADRVSLEGGPGPGKDARAGQGQRGFGEVEKRS